MARFNIHFSLLAFAVCLGSVQAGFAAPSVKRLGGGSIYTGTSSATAAKTAAKANSTRTAGRTASIRTIGMGGKINSTAGATNNANTARLSVGKYLHTAGVNAGIIKPVSSGTPSGSALDALSLRVDELESQMTTKVDDTVLNNYVTQTDIQNDYYTAEYIMNNYATKDSVETILDAISDLDTRLTAVESASGVVEPVSDWCIYGPAILVSLDPKCN